MLWFDFTCFVCDGLCLKEHVFRPFCFRVHSWCADQEGDFSMLLPAMVHYGAFISQWLTPFWIFYSAKFLCGGVFAVMSFVFSQAVWCSLIILCSVKEKVVLRLLPLLLEALYFDQSSINSVPIVLISRFFSVWMSLFELSFGFPAHLILLI